MHGKIKSEACCEKVAKEYNAATNKVTKEKIGKARGSGAAQKGFSYSKAG